jgi:hypothetical protein
MPSQDPNKQAQFLANVRREQAAHEKSYRAQALKLFPHVCGKCCREFAGKQLSELTVHHKDGDHFNNPPDGSNWELLCLYCHDDEHGAYERIGYSSAGNQGSSLGFNPFAGLGNLLQPKDKESDGKE